MSTINGLEGIVINTLDNLPHTNDFNDLTYLKVDGTNNMDAELDMNSYKIINLDDAKNPDEAVNLGQLTTVLGDYVTLNTSQTITADKVFRSSSATRPITLNRTSGTNPLFLRWDTSDNTVRWDIGSAANETTFEIRRVSGVLSTALFRFDLNQITSLRTISMNSNKIINLLDGTNPNDAVNVSQLTALGALYVLKTGDTMTGTLNMNTNDITNVKYLGVNINAPFAGVHVKDDYIRIEDTSTINAININPSQGGTHYINVYQSNGIVVQNINDPQLDFNFNFNNNGVSDCYFNIFKNSNTLSGNPYLKIWSGDSINHAILFNPRGSSYFHSTKVADQNNIALGIRTANPQEALHVEGNARINNKVIFNNNYFSLESTTNNILDASGTLNMNLNDIINIKQLIVTEYGEFINYTSGINGGWSLNSPQTVRIGDSARTGCINLRGSTSVAIIQATTANLHLDVLINNNAHGIYNNWYSSSANSYINSSTGTGCVLMGTFGFENNYKVSINRQNKTNALKINGNTDIITGNLKVFAGNIDMNNNKVINLATPINNNDAATKKYVDDKIIVDYQANTLQTPAGGTNLNINVQFRKISDIVDVTIPALIQFNFNTAGTITLATDLPVAYRPVAVQWIPIYVVNNSARQCGVINISTSGAVVIYAENAGNFGNNPANQNGFDSFTITYRTADII